MDLLLPLLFFLTFVLHYLLTCPCLAWFPLHSNLFFLTTWDSCCLTLSVICQFDCPTVSADLKLLLCGCQRCLRCRWSLLYGVFAVYCSCYVGTLSSVVLAAWFAVVCDPSNAVSMLSTALAVGCLRLSLCGAHVVCSSCCRVVFVVCGSWCVLPSSSKTLTVRCLSGLGLQLCGVFVVCTLAERCLRCLDSCYVADVVV